MISRERLLQFGKEFGIPLSPGQADLIHWALSPVGKSIETQSLTLPPTTNESLWLIGRCSGKTTVTVLLGIISAMIQHNTHTVVMSDALEKSDAVAMAMARRFSALVREYVAPRAYDALKPGSRRQAIRFKNGSELRMLPNRASAIRGFSIHHLILDEVGSWPQNSSLGCTVPQVLQASRARMAAEFPNNYRIMMLTTRPPGYNAFIENLIDKPPVNFTVVKASTLKMRPEFKPEQFQHISRCEYLREIECERVTDSEEAVIPIDLLLSCEVPAELLDRDRITGGRTLVSVDQAFKHDYAALAVITRTEERYYVHEFIRRRLNGSVPSLIALTKNTSEKYGNAPIIIDQHGSDSLSQLLREQGLNVRVQHWNNDNRESAFSNLRYLLEQKKIALPKNDALREEIVSLVVKRTPGGKRRIEGGLHDDLTFALLAGLESVKSRVLAPEVMMW